MIVNSSRMRSQRSRPGSGLNWPARPTRPATPGGMLAVGSAGIPFAAIAGHSGVAGIVISAATVLLSTAMVVTVPGWFQLLGLRQASHDLREIARLASDIGSVEDVERLGNLLPSLRSRQTLTAQNEAATASADAGNMSVPVPNSPPTPSAP